MDYEHNRKEFNSDTIEPWNEISTNAIQKWMARNPISSKGENMKIYNIVFFTSKKMFSLPKKTTTTNNNNNNNNQGYHSKLSQELTR